MEELINGNVDLVINDSPVSEVFVEQKKGELKLLDGYLASDDYGIAVRKGNEELLEKINTGLQNIRANGQYDEIKQRYFAQ